MALGPYCKAIGIEEEVLTGERSTICEEKIITNGVMWELRKYKTSKKLSTKELVDILIRVFQMKCENTEALQQELDRKYEGLLSLRATITKAPHKYRGELERLMNYAFDCPADMGMDPVIPFEPTVCANLGPKLLKVLKEKGGDDEDSVDMSGDDDDEQAKKRKAREEIIQLKKDLAAAKKIIGSLNDKMSDLNKRCQVLNDLSKSSVSERRRIENDIAKLSTEWSNVMVTWHDCMERLNHVNNNKGNYLDVGYMVRRNKTKQGIFDELSFEFEKTLEDFKHKVSSLIEKEKRKKKAPSREYRQKSKSDRKRVRQESDETEDAKKPCLSEEVSNAPISTSLSVDEFMKSEKVDEFKGGKYINALKAIYIELTSMPIPCNEVHEIIYNIIDDLEPLNTDKLPSPSFAGNIYMEARMAASLQAFSDLLKLNNVSICNDGTTKFCFQDATYDVTLPDETTLKLGVRDISQGNNDTSLSVLKDLFGEILGAKLDGNQAAESLVKIIKTSVTDNNLLDKKMIEILFLYKQQMSPIVANSLTTMPDVFRSKVIHLNNFCTGIYFLFGLAKLADVTILTWESMSSECDVETLKNSKKNLILSKTVQQMYKFSSKADPENVDEGSPEFETFTDKLKSLPLAPYHGNLFNIIFHNSAGIWFYHEVGILNEFISQMKEKEIENPFADLLNEKYSFAFARALGLIGKLVVVPLWTVLEDEENKIGLRYSSLLQKVVKWSKDATKFMKGQERLFDDVPVSHDAVYVSLIRDNEDSDVLTKELLELLFTSFVPFIKYFLTGNISDRNGESPMEVDNESKSPMHEDFSVFDRVTINIHSVTTYAKEALTLYVKTRNGEWQDKLSNKDNLKVFEFIEKDIHAQLKTLYERKIKLGAILNQGESLNNDSFQLREKKYKIIDEVIKYGGLWKNVEEVDSRIKSMKESDRYNAFKAQIQFRRHILGEENKTGLLDVASEGECFKVETLYQNLRMILVSESGYGEDSFLELATATDDKQKIAEITDLCANAQTLKSSVDAVKNIAPKENFHWLLGKFVSHTCILDQNKETVNGVCFARKIQCGASSYFFRYKNKGVFVVPDTRIAEDLRNQNLKVVEPSLSDLVGSRLSRAFIKNDGDFEWHDGKVVGVIGYSSDFVVEFDFYGANAQVEDGVDIPDLETFTFTINLLEEYRTDHLKLL